MAFVTAYLGLGTNLGPRLDNLREAWDLLPLPDGRLSHVRSSPIYETAPWGVASQPDFLNCVLEITTSLTPAELLDWVKEIEATMGREWSPRFGPRNIDIDILFYSGDVVDEPNLQIPHPRLHQRAFVLIPMADLALELRHPTLRQSIRELAAIVPDTEGVKPWGPPLDQSQAPDHCA